MAVAVCGEILNRTENLLYEIARGDIQKSLNVISFTGDLYFFIKWAVPGLFFIIFVFSIHS